MTTTGASQRRKLKMTENSRKIAVELGAKIYESDRECPRGHGNLRYTRNSTCVECAKITARRARDAGRIKKYKRRKQVVITVTIPAGHPSSDEAIVALLRALDLNIRSIKK